MPNLSPPNSTTVPVRNDSLFRLYRMMWRFAEGRRVHIVLVSLMLIAAQSFRLTIPWFFGLAVNALQQNGAQHPEVASRFLLLMLAAVGIAWVLHGPARIVERFTGLIIRERFADALYAKTLALPVRWHQQHHTGDTIHRMSKAATSLSVFAQSQFIYLQNFVSVIGPIIALYLVSSLTGTVALVGYSIIGLFVIRLDRVMVRLVQEENRSERKYNSGLADCLGNISSVLTLRLQSATRSMLASRLADIFAPLRQAIVFNEIKWGGLDLLNNALRTGLVAIYGFLEWKKNGTIAVGTAVMIHQYSQQIGTVVAALAMHWNDLVRQKTDVADTEEIWNTPSRINEQATIDQDWKHIQVSNIHFTHGASATSLPALINVSLSLRRGERIALVGESGSGKSSLLRTLTGLIQADSISFVIDGVSRPDLKHLESISMLIPQDTEIFESTVSHNITMGIPHRPQDIARACEIAALAQVVAQLPQGLETVISEKGMNLSGGQKQRLALARGTLAAKDISLLLLDEPTSSIDSVTEAFIYQQLFAAFPKTCIVSSIHRLHLLDHFDRVIVMEKGSIVDDGGVHQILDRQPQFFEHWRRSTQTRAAETEAA